MKKHILFRLSIVSVAVVMISVIPAFGKKLGTYSQWADSTRIIINTTSSGYNISSDQIGFPYLVRLSQKNFNFAQANGQGHDVRFSKAGVSLFYQIENWDSLAQKAAIWVRIDTIKGNTDSQVVTMYWGKSDAADSSNGPAVFDTANGFVGVWHFTTLDPSYRLDATFNSDTAKSKGSILTPSGAIGVCDSFVGANKTYDSVAGGINLANKNFTLSAWAKLTNPADTSTNGMIVSQGTAAADSALHFGYNGHAGKYTFRFYADDIDQSSAFAGGSYWHMIAGTYDTSTKKQSLYVDGNLDNSRTANGNYAGYGTVGIGSLIWKTITGDFFNGSIDEVVIAQTARSSDWIKLAYQNQKVPPDAVPTIRYPVRDIQASAGVTLDADTPATTGIIDSFTITPATLPMYLYFDPHTGVIAGYPYDTCSKTVYYVRAINSLGYSEDTLALTVVDQSTKANLKNGAGMVARLLGVKGVGKNMILFSLPFANSISKVSFRLFDCRGVMTWSSDLRGAMLHGGVQSVKIGSKGHTTGNSGVYFLQMITTDAFGKDKLVGKSSLTLFR